MNSEITASILIEGTLARFIIRRLHIHVVAHFRLIVYLRLIVWITRKICHRSRSHHAGRLLAGGQIAAYVLLELGVKFGLAGVLCYRDGVSISIISSTLILVLVLLLLVPVLVTWLKHLLDQFLPFALFVHYLNVELGYLVGILHLNRHLLELLLV